MKKHMINGILIILAAIMVIGSTPILISATGLDAVKEEKADLEQKKKDIDSIIAALEHEKGDILNYIEKLDTQLNELTERIIVLTTEIEEAEADLEVAKEELKLAKDKEEKQYDCMKKRVQYIYENGEPSFIGILLESKSISEFLNQVEIRSKITEYDNNIFNEYARITKEVSEKEQELEVKVADLNLMQEELEYEQDAVMILVEEKNKELTSNEDELMAAEIVSNEYDAELEEKLKEIEHLEEEERKRAEEELRRQQEEERKRREQEELTRIAKVRAEEEAKRQAEAANPENNVSQGNSSTGSFIWPTSGRVSSGFGWRGNPFGTGGSEFHGGIDIAASYGTPIVAAASGTVTAAGYGSGNGNYIYLSHGNGLVTKYLHASSLAVGSGTYVEKGQVIAYVGSTGRSTGNHLHFQIEVYGSPTNPYNYL